MEKRERQIDETKEEMNNVEDKIFWKFCKNIGVANIRQYEEKELQTQQDKEKKKLE
jgi:structural maintenance of chromosome 1